MLVTRGRHRLDAASVGREVPAAPIWSECFSLEAMEGPPCRGQGCPHAGEVLRFFLIYFIQFSRRGLASGRIPVGNAEDCSSHVHFGVRWPLPAPPAPPATCPWLSAVPARPPPGGTRSPSPRVGQGQPRATEDRAEQAAEPVTVFAVHVRSGLILEKSPPHPHPSGRPAPAPARASPVAPVLSS